MRSSFRRLMGIIFISGGILLLLQSLDIITGDFGNVFWALIFGALGLFFTSFYWTNKKNWWWLIPGITLLGLGISNLVTLIPGVGDSFSGFFALAGIGLGFALIYLNNRENWWALIPGGVLVSLSVVTLFEDAKFSNFDSGGILFLGIGLTFLLLYLLPTPFGRLNWALIPAIIMILFGLVIGFGGQYDIWGYVGPVVIILLGGLILYNAFRKNK